MPTIPLMDHGPTRLILEVISVASPLVVVEPLASKELQTGVMDGVLAGQAARTYMTALVLEPTPLLRDSSGMIAEQVLGP
jgi:hypothetical protein